MTENGREQLVVYGACCVWWDTIDKTSRTAGAYKIPCCPHCGGVLYQMEWKKWWEAVDKIDSERPGYRAMVEWWRGKCFPTYDDVQVAFAEHLEQQRGTA